MEDPPILAVNSTGTPDDPYLNYSYYDLANIYEDFVFFSNNTELRDGDWQRIVALQDVIMWLHKYYTPFISTFGILCNVFAFITLCLRRITLACSSQYLIAFNIVDAVYLFGVLCEYIPQSGPDLYRIGGWCQMTIFIEKSTTFLSLWLRAFYTLDVFLMLCFRNQHGRWCTVNKTKVLIAAVGIISIVVYLNISLTSGVAYYYNRPLCVHFTEFLKSLNQLKRIDVFLNILFPNVAMFYMLCHTTWKIVIKESGTNNNTQNCEILRLFFPIVISYLLLCLPRQLLQFGHIIREMFLPEQPLTHEAYLWQVISYSLFHTRYAINCFLLFCASKAFRQACCQCLGAVFKKMCSGLSRALCLKGRQETPTVMAWGPVIQVTDCDVSVTSFV